MEDKLEEFISILQHQLAAVFVDVLTAKVEHIGGKLRA
jgi:hypothetical protein